MIYIEGILMSINITLSQIHLRLHILQLHRRKRRPLLQYLLRFLLNLHQPLLMLQPIHRPLLNALARYNDMLHIPQKLHIKQTHILRSRHSQLSLLRVIIVHQVLSRLIMELSIIQ